MMTDERTLKLNFEADMDWSLYKTDNKSVRSDWGEISEISTISFHI